MKTWWQKIYSFFGFWTYMDHTLKGNQWSKYFVVYWCMFPFWFVRKFDLFRWKVDTYTTGDLKEKLKELNKKLDEKG